MKDTRAGARARYFELLRSSGPEKRLAICASLSRTTRELAIAGIKRANVGRALSEAEIRNKLAERLYGREVAERYFKVSP